MLLLLVSAFLTQASRTGVVRAMPTYIFPVGSRGAYRCKVTVSLEKDDAVVSHFVVSDAHGRAVARFEDGADPIEMIFAFPPTEPNRSLLFVRRNGNHTFGNVYLVSPKGIRSVWDTSTSWTIEPRQLGGRWRIVVQRYSFQLGGERLEKQWGPSALEVYDVLRSSVSENSHAWRIARRHLSRK